MTHIHKKATNLRHIKVSKRLRDKVERAINNIKNYPHSEEESWLIKLIRGLNI